jgi:putative ABC transport system permease protein
MGSLAEDVRLAFRVLMKDRGFAALTVVTLAVAIGANTAIFSVVDGVLVRPLPYPEPDRVVSVRTGTIPAPGRTGDLPFSDRGYWHFHDNNHSFSAFGGYVGGEAGIQLSLTGQGEPVQVNAIAMTQSAFEVLGTPPALGRLFTPEEDVPGQPQVALLGHRFFTGYFGGNPSVIGRRIDLGNFSVEVIGVMPQGFDFPSPEIDMWIPRGLDPESENFGGHSIWGIARLAPNATVESAVEDSESLIARFAEAGYGPTWFTGVFSGKAFVRTLQDEVVGDVRTPLLILLGAMAFLLLIACSNVANLFLVRAEARTRESAVRLALGSGRGRLVRYVLTESMILALVGGVGGIALAYLGTKALVAIAPAAIPRLDEIRIRGSVLVYTAGLSVLAGLLFGVLPALRSGSDRMLGSLRDGGRGATVGRERHLVRRLLVVGQVALALIVLVGSGLMVRSFEALRNTDQGFDPDGVLTFRLAPSPAKHGGTPEGLAQFYDDLIARLDDMPGVTSAGAVTVLPLQGVGSRLTTRIDEFPLPEDEFPPSFLIRRATPGYFETMRIPVLEGREFTADDHNSRLGTLIISESIKDRYWPDQSALDKRMQTAGAPAHSVGVVGDVHALGTDLPVEPAIYKPMLDSVGGGVSTMSMVVRVDGGPLALAPSIRSTIQAIDPDLPISDMRTMNDLIGDSLSRTSFTMTLLVLAAAIAVLLGSVGVYGVMSYVSSQRTAEIGVRMALGSDPGRVRRMILAQGLKIAGAGVAAGLVGALATGRILASLLYGVSPRDPLTLVVGSVIFLAIAALAAWVPARRAAKTPPAVALQA